MEEFRYIESQQHVSVPLEELFLDLGERSQVEDIENFASVFYTAKTNRWRYEQSDPESGAGCWETRLM